MKKENAPWQQKLILVCRKCGEADAFKNQAQSAGSSQPHVKDSENVSDELRLFLKKELTAKNLWGPVRAVGTTCLGLCPDRKVSVAFIDAKSRELVSVDPVLDRHDVLKKACD
jgi:hypothetical protein